MLRDITLRDWFAGADSSERDKTMVDLTTAIPPKDWKVTRLIDRGPSEFYRYHVQGCNLNLTPEDIDYHFVWSVPRLSERYDLADAQLIIAGPGGAGTGYIP